jgi:hypothetical protein
MFGTHICFPFISTPYLFFSPHNAGLCWVSLGRERWVAINGLFTLYRILRERVEGRYNVSIPLHLGVIAVCFRQPVTLKGATSDVAFRYLLNLEAFKMNSRVPFDKFKYVARCSQVSKDQLFPCTLPYRILTKFVASYDDEELRYHPKRLSLSPLPLINSHWLQLIVRDKTWLVDQLVNEKKVYCCAICEMLLFDGKIGPFSGCVWFYSD